MRKALTAATAGLAIGLAAFGALSAPAAADERASTQALIERSANAPQVRATAPEARGEYASFEDALIAADLDYIVSEARTRQRNGEADPRDTVVLVLDALVNERLDLATALLDGGSIRGAPAAAFYRPFVTLAEGDLASAVSELQEAAAILPAPMADIGTALLLEAGGRREDAARIYQVVESQLDTTPVEGEPRTLEEFQETLNATRTYTALMQAALANQRLGRHDEAERVYALAAEFASQAAQLQVERARNARSQDPLTPALTWQSALGRWLFLLSDYAAQTEGLATVLRSDGPVEGLASPSAALFSQFGLLFDTSADDWRLSAAGDLRAADGFDGADRLLAGIDRRSIFAGDAALGRAEIALRQDRDSDAQQHAREAIREADGRWAMVAGAGDVLRETYAEREAIRAFDQALNLAGDEVEDRASVLLYRASALRFFGRFDEAARDAREALRIDRTDTTRLFFISILMDHPTDWQDGIAEARALLAEAPDSVLRLNALGYALIQRPEGLEEGYRLLWRGYTYNERNDAVVDSLGWAYYFYGQFEQARALIERANELSGSDPNAEILDHLGDVYWRLGRQEEARDAWRQAIEARPETWRRESLEAKVRDGLTTPAPATVTPPNVQLPDRQRTQEET
jgi:tetratricopeptide (TPR) repeat protein